MDTAKFPQRTTSPVARRLHAILRYCKGYQEVCDSPSRVKWVVNSVLHLAREDLPVGCRDAALTLRSVRMPRRLTSVLSIDQTCKLLVELGRYRVYQHEQEEAFSREQSRKRAR